MDKLYTCVGCSKDFKVLNKPDLPVYKQHEVEMNVECPFCSKTNAIVWPQDESLPAAVDAKLVAADFGTEVTRFRTFLGQNRYPENIIWLMPEDVVLSGKRFLYVRVPIRSTNETIARNIYDEGVAQGRGLLMSTICEMEISTCCYVWFPRCPEEEPEGLWPQDGSVKMSVQAETPRMVGKPVKNGMLWELLKLRHRKIQHLKGLLFSHANCLSASVLARS
jgi:DNA-directed RNA polymerase subunit RPC12/RpoP